MMVYNCIVVDVGSGIFQVIQIELLNYELIRRPVLVTYWLLNLIGAN